MGKTIVRALRVLVLAVVAAGCSGIAGAPTADGDAVETDSSLAESTETPRSTGSAAASASTTAQSSAAAQSSTAAPSSSESSSAVVPDTSEAPPADSTSTNTSPTMAPAPVTTVSTTHLLEPDDAPLGGAMVLGSPDGRLVFTVQKGHPCITVIADGTSTCATDSSLQPVGQNWASWSADSSTVAFTEDLENLRIDPDIWTMDASTGTVHNLTDDAESATVQHDANDTLIDRLPVWAGDSIVFVREPRVSGSGTTIESINASGGPVTTLARLDGVTVDFVNGLALSPQGDALAYSVGDHGHHPATVHVLSLADGASSAVLETPYDATSLSFSPDGQFLLAGNLLYESSALDYDGDPDAKVVATDTGEIASVAPNEDAWSPVWSPTGHALAFFTGAGGTGAVHLVSEPGGESAVVSTSDDYVRPGQRLTWTESGLIVRTTKGVAVLELAE